MKRIVREEKRVGANDTRRLRVVVTGESSGAQQSLEQVGNSADKSESKLASLAKTVAGFAGKGVLALGAVGAAAATMGISTATNLEKVTVGFTTMLGSATKAQAFLKQLQQFANTTPFEFDDVTGAAQKFLSMGFAAKDVIPMLTAVGDAVAAMGGGAEQIDSVTTALSQMQVKGHVAGDEIMQLSEQGVPALQILADGFGVSTQQMQKMISNGSVLSGKAIPLIVKGLEDGTQHVKGFGGMMQAQSETMAGKWSTFMDTMKTGLGNLAYKFLPIAKKAVDIASTAFQSFFSGLSGTGSGGISALYNFGAALTAFFKTAQGETVNAKGLVGQFANFGAAIRAAITAFQDGKTASDGFAGELETVAVWLRKLVDAAKATADGVTVVIGWLREHDKVAAALAITMGTLVAVTKAYAIVTAVQAAGGILGMVKNLTLIQNIMKVVTALQWAYNGAMAAAAYLRIAGYLTGLSLAQKAVAAATKIATAAQWLWDAALDANPIGIVIVAIAAFVAAIVILWKNNEGFRNWVVNVLWASLKRAWEQITGAVQAAVGGMIAAWNGFKNGVLAIWNAIIGFLRPIASAIAAVLSPIFQVIGKIASVFNAFYVNVWKALWILIQIAVKIFIAYFTNIWWPAVSRIFNFVAGIVRWLANGVWGPAWGTMKAIAGAIADWFNNKIVASWNRAFTQIRNFLSDMKRGWDVIWDAIKAKVQNVINNIAGPVLKIYDGAVAKFKLYLAAFQQVWGQKWDAIKNKITGVVNGIKGAFNNMRDGIKSAWDKIVSLTKAPVNFLINSVYDDRIVPFFNKLASSFGIKTRLSNIKGFAKGGMVPGTGRGDTVPAYLTPGEGILTLKEMRALGGAKGFNALRQSIQGYAKGGIVGDAGGWVKSLAGKASGFIQGIASSAVKPLVNTLHSFINSHMSPDGVSGYLRAGGNNVLDKLLAWVSGKDKEASTSVAGSALAFGRGAISGWRNMLAAINGAGFNFHPSVGQTYGGTHATGSYHYQGRAVDLSPPSMKAFNWILGTYGKNIKELIYGPAGGRSIKNGRPHNYSSALLAQHYNHIHWAMDEASTVQPGWFAGYNGTGKPETLVNADKIGSGDTHVTININGSGDPKAVAKEVRNEFIKLSKRNGNRAGLPNK
jgi:tape measure domain-containing protein